MALFGAGGHAKVVIDLVEKQQQLPIAFLADDDAKLWGQPFYGYPVIGGKSALLSQWRDHPAFTCLVTVGSNPIRARLAAWLQSEGIAVAAACAHPSAQVARGVVIDQGTVLMALTAINADSVIGRHVIVNTGASVDHDCVIGDAVHLAPGVRLCGGVTVGECTLIGVGAVVLPNIRIGSNVTVGAGATVIENVPDGATVVGTPARRVLP
ncbi:MAG: acetyltransferase [Methylococcaceae bacterium]|nr:MAG: acetyltransferase [Methylococcaceae bacterium]